MPHAHEYPTLIYQHGTEHILTKGHSMMITSDTLGHVFSGFSMTTYDAAIQSTDPITLSASAMCALLYLASHPALVEDWSTTTSEDYFEAMYAFDLFMGGRKLGNEAVLELFRKGILDSHVDEFGYETYELNTQPDSPDSASQHAGRVYLP